MKKMLTIITPTYNRAEKLKVLFESLNEQKCKDFVWHIIDDGSTDSTKEVVNKFITSEFKIKYIYKQNGGKHTALNIGFENLETQLAIIVDSDDYLTNDAVERIKNDWKKYSGNKKLCGLCYLRKSANSQLLESFPDDEMISNYNEYIINKQKRGDKAEVFNSEILRNYSFPTYNGEKFVGEGVLWSKISHDYDMVFINHAIYVCEYLDGGLTKSGRKMRINNPKGGMFHAKEYLSNRYTFKIRFKNSLLYLTYSRFAKISVWESIKDDENKFILYLSILPSYILFLTWKWRYLKND